jgi:hypothetical protein
MSAGNFGQLLLTNAARTVTRKSKFVGFLIALFFVTGIFGQASQTFNTAGTFSFTVPPGVNQVTVNIWGAGGAGGGSTAAITSGGGGGGGAYTTGDFRAYTRNSLQQFDSCRCWWHRCDRCCGK